MKDSKMIDQLQRLNQESILCREGRRAVGVYVDKRALSSGGPGLEGGWSYSCSQGAALRERVTAQVEPRSGPPSALQSCPLGAGPACGLQKARRRWEAAGYTSALRWMGAAWRRGVSPHLCCPPKAPCRRERWEGACFASPCGWRLAVGLFPPPSHIDKALCVPC